MDTWIRLLKMAFRNIFRFKRRTIITFSAISLGPALLIVSISLMNGIDKQSISNIIDCQTSHLKIFKKGYFDKRDKMPMEMTIAEPASIRKIIDDIPSVKASESRILFGAALIKGMDELPCQGAAVQPDLDPKLFSIKQSLVAGNWLEPGKDQVLIGNSLARDMELSVGDIVTVRLIASSMDEEFSWNAVDFTVQGIFDSGNPSVDSSRLIIPMDRANEALSMNKKVTEIVVRLDNDSDATILRVQKEIEARLKDSGQPLEVYTWKDLAGTFLMISKMKTQRQGMIIFIMMLIASMGIINTMLMSVLERTREIGMMVALGMKKREIMSLFIFEGGFIGVLGSTLGCLLGGLAARYLEIHGWSLSSFGKTMEKMSSALYPVKDVFYADLTLGLLVMTFFIGTAMAIAASYYPARKAAKMNPIDALRHI